MDDISEHCRVCGFDVGEPLWIDGNPTYVICDCCGAEAGVDEVTRKMAVRWRTRWLARGAPWYEPRTSPVGWNLAAAREQLRFARWS